MATFGNYETVREIHRSGLASVWSARGPGASEPAFAVKLCEPDVDIAGPEAAQQAVAAFLNQAKVQKEAAAAGGHWAPVHESGTRASGAYLVTDLFPRSADKLSLSRVKTDPAALRAIVSGVIKGLRELEQACARQHGNLKASNVLLGPGEMVAARVALCDPLPSRAARGLKPGADGRALADLIHLLVTHQPLRGAFPITASAEWSALGRARDAWLGLCNRLLDPHPQNGPATLEEIGTTLSGRPFDPPRGRVSRPVLIASIAAGVILSGGAAVLLVRGGGESAAIIPELGIAWEPDGRQNWETLCQAYIDGFYSFIESLDRPPDAQPGGPARRDLYLASDPRLAAPLDLLSAARRDKMDSPGRIIGRSSADPVTLKTSEPEKAQTGQGMAQTGRLLDVIRGFEAAVDTDWPPTQRLTAGADAVESRGWRAVGEGIRSFTAPAARPPWRERAARLDVVLAADSLTTGIQGRLTRLDGMVASLAAEKDPVLGLFSEVVSGAGGTDVGTDALGALRALDAALAEAERLGGRLADAVKSDWQRVDREFFTTTSAVYVSRGDRRAGELLDTWLVEVRQPRYAQLDPSADPVAAWPTDQRIADIDARLQGLRDEQDVEPDEELVVRLDEFGGRATRLKDDASGVKSLIWNRANEARKIADAARVRADAETLLKEVGDFISVRNRAKVASAADARDKLRADAGPGGDSEALAAAWGGWRDALVAQINETNYKPIAKRAGEARDVLARAGAAFPPAPGAGDARRAWSQELARVAAREREARLGTFLNAHPQPPELGDGADIESAADLAGRDLGVWLAGLKDLEAALRDVEDLLNAGYGLVEEPGAGAPPIARRSEAVGASPVLAHPEVAAACRPVTGRVEALAAIERADTLTELGAVLTPGGSSDPEAVIAAGRRLDALPGWPASPADLAQAAAFRDRVAAEIGRIGDESRQAVLRQRLADSAGARWRQAMRAVSEPADIEAVVGAMGAFGVSPAQIEDPRLRYNALAADLRRFVAGAPGVQAAARSDEEVRVRAAEFLSAFAPLSAGLSTDPKVAPVIDATRLIAEGAEPPVPKVDVTKLGPGAAGWTGALTGEGQERLRFSGPNNAELDFVLLPQAEGMAAPAFVGTTEVSVGLVLVLASAPDRRGAMEALMPPADTIRGPSAWTRAGGAAALNATWLDPAAARNIANYNEPNLALVVRAVTDTGRPALEHPAQQISPSAAAYIARSLGCRLPTAAEWKAAMASLSGPQVRNLRDRAWADRLAKVRAFDDALVNDVRKGSWMPWPDRGAFVPRGVGTPPRLGRDATPGTTDDGEAWFMPAAAEGPGPHHLVGNAAEIVCEAPAELEALVDTSAESVRAFVNSNAPKFAVIGGSALSAPELPVDQALPLDALDVEDQVGYADVGFRLAFSAEGVAPKRKSFAVRVAEALTENPYLPAR